MKNGTLPPEGGSVPANAAQVIWRKSRVFSSENAPELRLYAVEGGSRRALAFDLTSLPGDTSGALQKVVPRAPIAPGSELVVEADELCLPDDAPFTSSLHVGPAAPPPSSLGALEIAAQGDELVQLWVTSGECYRETRVASARVRVALSDAARPYADLLRYELQVDGQPYTSQEAPSDWRQQPSRPVIGAGALGRGADRVYHVCESGARAPTSGVAEGQHRVQMFALLPDGTRIGSDEITLELRCALPDAGADAGARDDGGAGASADDAGPTSAIRDASILGGANDRDAESDRAASTGAVQPALDSGAFDQVTDDVRSAPARERGETGHCSPLIGARTGRPLLWGLFVLVLSIVASRTKRRRHVPGSARQSAGDSTRRSSPRL